MLAVASITTATQPTTFCSSAEMRNTPIIAPEIKKWSGIIGILLILVLLCILRDSVSVILWIVIREIDLCKNGNGNVSTHHAERTHSLLALP